MISEVPIITNLHRKWNRNGQYFNWTVHSSKAGITYKFLNALRKKAYNDLINAFYIRTQDKIYLALVSMQCSGGQKHRANYIGFAPFHGPQPSLHYRRPDPESGWGSGQIKPHSQGPLQALPSDSLRVTIITIWRSLSNSKNKDVENRLFLCFWHVSFPCSLQC